MYLRKAQEGMMPGFAFLALSSGVLEPAERLDSCLNSVTFSKTQSLPQPSIKMNTLRGVS